jgi:hypothetical protein
VRRDSRTGRLLGVPDTRQRLRRSSQRSSQRLLTGRKRSTASLCCAARWCVPDFCLTPSKLSSEAASNLELNKQGFRVLPTSMQRWCSPTVCTDGHARRLPACFLWQTPAVLLRRRKNARWKDHFCKRTTVHSPALSTKSGADADPTDPAVTSRSRVDGNTGVSAGGLMQMLWQQ